MHQWREVPSIEARKFILLSADYLDLHIFEHGYLNSCGFALFAYANSLEFNGFLV